jgi:hypothetical protein
MSGAVDDLIPGHSPHGRVGTGFHLGRAGTGDLLEEDDSDSSYDSFNLSLQKKALFGLEGAETLLNTESDDATLKPRSTTAWKNENRDSQVTVYRVYRSRYDGLAFENGNLTAELLTGTNRKMFQRELSKPLFRWMYEL